MKSKLLMLAAVVVAFGCNPPSSKVGTGALEVTVLPPLAPIVDLRADTNRSGAIEMEDPTEDTNEDTWDATHGAVFFANIDDDGARCSSGAAQLNDANIAKCNDASDEVINGAEDQLDLAPLQLRAFPDAPADTVATLSVNGPAATKVRFFHASGTAFAGTGALTLEELRTGAAVFLEGRDIARKTTEWDGTVDVTLSVTLSTAQQSYKAGTFTDTVRLRVAPLLTPSHVEAATSVFVTRVPQDPESTTFNGALRAHTTASGSSITFTPISVNDQWTQDFFETGYMTVPGPNRTQRVMTVFIRSANLEDPGSSNPMRPAGRVVFTQFRGRDVGAIQQVDLRSALDSQSLNSFGNLETIPPYTFNGKSYPLGRHLRGAVTGFRPDESFDAMLAAQRLQPTVEIDTQWLEVGHVDETTSFLKTPSTPRGWVLVVNDARMAKRMLQDQVDAGNGAVEMFVGQYWVDDTGADQPASISISGALANADVMMASNEAAVKVDEQLAIITAATGLTEAEIIRIPYLHQPTGYGSLAYNPGTVNMLVIDGHNVVVPDPHGPVIGGVDIFKAQFEAALMPYQYTVRWIDDWNLYHRLAGEVHCGTNALRTIPSAKWWEVTP